MMPSSAGGTEQIVFILRGDTPYHRLLHGWELNIGHKFCRHLPRPFTLGGKAGGPQYTDLPLKRAGLDRLEAFVALMCYMRCANFA